MKIRKGFVSNSSSSSFVIAKKHLTEEQIWAIKNHGLVGEWFEVIDNEMRDEDEELIIHYFGDEWKIIVEEDSIRGLTWMDNFDMKWFLRRIGVDGVQFDED